MVKGCQLPSTAANKLTVREQDLKQGQNKECQAPPWLSMEEAGVQEEGSQQHFLLLEVWGQKIHWFIFKLITHSQPVLKRSCDYQQNSGSNLPIYLLPKQRMKSGLPSIPWNSNTWIKQEIKWQKAFWSTPKFVSNGVTESKGPQQWLNVFQFFSLFKNNP